MNVLYHPSKANVEVDALNKLSIGSVAHVKEERKELAKYVHRLARLGVCLTDTSNSGVIVQNGSESSLIAEKGLGTQVNLSTTFYPQMDGQAERTIQTLEDILRSCVINSKGEAAFIGPDSIYEAIEKVQHIRDRLKVAQSRQKAYADVRRRDLGFEIDDWVFVKVSHMKGR
ncbi:hypothetical protein MTR67_035467 [Solanum verrucosum]|uniref:Uncharacterized protein n=1 Tax=Solanum verrucosum TaxID=315347 RepID=A0AAF0U9Z7_SOLVR|nr:hypothetical protein MTR67_035467 [Solanum verrucosum]